MSWERHNLVECWKTPWISSKKDQLQNFPDLETWRVFLLGASYRLRTCLYTCVHIGSFQMLQQWNWWRLVKVPWKNSDDYFPTDSGLWQATCDSKFVGFPSSWHTVRYDFTTPKSEFTWVIQSNTNPNTARCFGERYLRSVDPTEEIFPIKK